MKSIKTLTIGFDDTDSSKGMCTTFLAYKIVDELKKEKSELLDFPNLIRFNPNIPWKTRGNGAVSMRVRTKDPSKIKNKIKNLVEKYAPRRFLDATNFVVMPGLIDAYAHAGHAMIKGIWHQYRGWPSNDLYFNATTEEFWYADGLLAAVDRIKCGVTTGVSIIGATPARIA